MVYIKWRGLNIWTPIFTFNNLSHFVEIIDPIKFLVDDLCDLVMSAAFICSGGLLWDSMSCSHRVFPASSQLILAHLHLNGTTISPNCVATVMPLICDV